MSRTLEVGSDSPLGPHKPATRQVSDHLQQLILRGGLKPGDRLPSQRELSLQLGVSRPSLREAMTLLQTMGLITIGGNRYDGATTRP